MPAKLPWSDRGHQPDKAVRSRLDPAHHGTGRVLSTYEELLSRIDPAKVLVPSDADWLAAGELAGGGGKIATAFDRVELISDALTAILALKAGGRRMPLSVRVRVCSSRWAPRLVGHGDDLHQKLIHRLSGKMLARAHARIEFLIGFPCGSDRLRKPAQPPPDYRSFSLRLGCVSNTGPPGGLYEPLVRIVAIARTGYCILNVSFMVYPWTKQTRRSSYASHRPSLCPACHGPSRSGSAGCPADGLGRGGCGRRESVGGV